MVSEAGAAARRMAVISFLITALFAVLLSYLITRSITKPLVMLVKKTREIPTGIFTCDLDVSSPPEIRELAEAFRLMCDRLKEVDRIKTDFFAMISHELKTPLTTIKEGTSLLLEGVGGSITEKQGKLLTIIATESKRLTGLVNSILDLSKMEAGMMMYTFEPGRIAPLIDQAVKEIAPYAEAKGIHMEKQINTDLSFYRMDGERILDVLRNLLGNAVKFTPEGGQRHHRRKSAGWRAEGFRKRFGSRYPQGSSGAHIRKVRKFGSKKRDGAGIGYRQTHRGGTWRKGMGGKRSGKRKHIHLCIAVLILLSPLACAFDQMMSTRMVDASGEEARAHLVLGRKFFAEGNFASALKENEKVLSLAGRDTPIDEALFSIGLIHAHFDNLARDYGKSLIALRKLIKDYPGSPLAQQAKVIMGLIQDNDNLNRRVERLNTSSTSCKKRYRQRCEKAEQRAKIRR